jgi:hypothetical protein
MTTSEDEGGNGEENEERMIQYPEKPSGPERETGW